MKEVTITQILNDIYQDWLMNAPPINVEKMLNMILSENKKEHSQDEVR